jgi:hypothetical protein
MHHELRSVLDLQLNTEYFVSKEQMKKENRPIFFQNQDGNPVGFVPISGERYRVHATGRPIEGLIPILRSGK